jgi:hypothetical protein
MRYCKSLLAQTTIPNLFFMCAESVLASFGSNLSPQRAFVRLATDGNAQIGVEAQDFQQSE